MQKVLAFVMKMERVTLLNYVLITYMFFGCYNNVSILDSKTERMIVTSSKKLGSSSG